MATSDCLITERVFARCDDCGRETLPCHLVEELGRLAFFCPFCCPVHTGMGGRPRSVARGGHLGTKGRVRASGRSQSVSGAPRQFSTTHTREG